MTSASLPGERPAGRVQPDVTFRELPDGRTRVEATLDGQKVSHLQIVPLTIRVGAATLRMDGIADVATETQHRQQGYARRMLQATVDYMRRRDAALTMLYGIPDFYGRFGYATAGPDHLLHLKTTESAPALPDGWSARALADTDLPHLQRLYELGTARSSGAAVRAETSWVWAQLREGISAAPTDAPADAAAGAPSASGPGAACRVLVGPDGRVDAYAWRGAGFWYLDMMERRDGDAFCLAEVMAGSPGAADAALALCRQWGAEAGHARGRPITTISLGLPPDSLVAAAAMFQDATFERRFAPAADSMARVLDIDRLLTALAPELTERVRVAELRQTTTLTIETEEGVGALLLTPDGAAVVPPGGAAAQGAPESLNARLPQSDLARLALGAFPPQDLLDRLPLPLADRTRDLLGTLFPARYPHMYWPDRY
ncbi:MAG: GNAT family N-acetyltransferase [Chloroflexota bacterium]|nr:GNAT family N-acetyltransferase [Chloroflexota bacterium]